MQGATKTECAFEDAMGVSGSARNLKIPVRVGIDV
jgi:hypothetical protein